MKDVNVSVQVDPAVSEGAPGQAELDLVETAARSALRAMDVPIAELSITLLDDTGMAELNERWLGHAGPTDVISFPLFEEAETPVGDVYIGLTQAQRQATFLAVPLREELARLAIHGTLHVLGLDHPAGAGRESSPMWQMQERILAEVMKP